ncbi:homeodomain-like protein [Tanacetum coccineum]|uniref:Homeodomain-like protein n=1 Tax=Tanacetum coccineum TaxID=301880 RepID=A0ABQ5HDK5_9ASTR
MTRSSTSELFTPYKEPEREFQSSIRHLKTLSLDELRSPGFNLFFEQEYSEEEEEVKEPMAKTMEEYMSKTRADYGSGVVRPKIEERDSFELKGQFLKELRSNTFSGSDHEDANEHIKKVLEIVDLFYIPNITIDQVMLRAFPVSLTEAASRWLRNKPTGSITTWEDLKAKFLSKYCPPARTTKKMKDAEVVLFYNGLDVPTRQILDSRGAIPSKTAADAKERGFESLPSSTETNPRDQVKSISTTIKADKSWIRRIGSNQYALSTGQNSKLVYKSIQMTVSFPSHLDNRYCEEEEGIYGPKFTEAYGASHINHTIPQKEKDPGSFTLPCFINNVCFDNALGDLGASSKIDVYKRKITLRVGEEKIIFKSVKPASSLIRRVYMLSLRERMKLDLEARFIRETLVLNRSLDPFLEDYIKLNDLNEPIELRRNQGDDLMPTIEEGDVIEEFRTRDEDLDTGIDDYPSYCHDDKKIHIDCAHNLRFSCMIGFKFTHANFFPLLYVTVVSKKFHNSIMKDKMVYKGNNVVGAVMNVPIFVGTFSVVTNFAVLENMDAYRDEGMSDVIVGKLFLREVGIKAKLFEGIIILYKNDDEATYQMVRSHPRFNNHTNEQCNKIPPLLKVREKDEKNGISHAYQKLKGFHKGVLNLGPEYI